MVPPRPNPPPPLLPSPQRQDPPTSVPRTRILFQRQVEEHPQLVKRVSCNASPRKVTNKSITKELTLRCNGLLRPIETPPQVHQTTLEPPSFEINNHSSSILSNDTHLNNPKFLIPALKWGVRIFHLPYPSYLNPRQPSSEHRV